MNENIVLLNISYYIILLYYGNVYSFSFLCSLMKDRSDLERERDSLRVELNMLKNKANIHENSIQQLRSSLEAKVRSMVYIRSFFVDSFNLAFYIILFA